MSISGIMASGYNQKIIKVLLGKGSFIHITCDVGKNGKLIAKIILTMTVNKF